MGQLFSSWRDSIRSMSGMRAFLALPPEACRIVFYAETAADWAYLGPVCQALEAAGERVIKVCSDASDPMLKGSDAFYVGFGTARTILFKSIQAEAFVMTLCDLETFHLKRSPRCRHYFYIFHSIASTHRVYREHAFDAYDTILCVGPHHIDEIRRTEEVYKLRPKRLAPHGYGRLDTLMADIAQRPAPIRQRPADAPINVLLAPTWGDCSIVRHCLRPMIETLLDGGFLVTLRLHPMTRRHHPDLADSLLESYAGGGRFRFDPHINTTDSLLDADIMISEWSGAPLEYAFARERPVIFIDTEPKVHNANFHRIGMPLLEDEIRTQIGMLVAPDDLSAIPGAVRSLVAEADAWAPRIREVRDRCVFNVGHSGEVGAKVILETLAEMRESGAAGV